MSPILDTLDGAYQLQVERQRLLHDGPRNDLVAIRGRHRAIVTVEAGAVRRQHAVGRNSSTPEMTVFSRGGAKSFCLSF